MIGAILYLWIGFLVLCVITEAITWNLVAIWFIPGTLLAILLALLSVSAWIQVLVFAVCTAILLVATRPLAKKMLHGKLTPTNADRVLHQTGIVTEEISVQNGTGQIKVLKQIWSARAEQPEKIIAVGTPVRVLQIEGVFLIVSSDITDITL